VKVNLANRILEVEDMLRRYSNKTFIFLDGKVEGEHIKPRNPVVLGNNWSLKKVCFFNLKGS